MSSNGALIRAVVQWQQPYGRQRWAAIAVLALLVVLVTGLVWVTGGIKYVWSHSMFLPILLGGLLFGPWGGLVAGLVAGLSLGPLMPIDTQTGEVQETLNWLYRLGFFVLIGALNGLLVRAVTDLVGRDPVTGAPSQVPLRRDLQRMFAQHAEGQLSGFSLLLVKLTNHPEVVASLGRDTGRSLVRTFVSRLEAASPSAARVYHLHGETFGVIVPRAELATVRGVLQDRLRAPVELGGVPIQVRWGMGRADVPEHARAVDTLVQQATSAVQSVRGSFDAEVVYDASHDRVQRENLLLLSGLRHAITAGQLRLHYQWQVSTRTGQPLGVEALVRWQHPEWGLLPPGRFVPQAETTDLIYDLTRWVLVTAAAEIAAPRTHGMPLVLAVNLSARDLHDPGLLPAIDAALAASGLPPEQLEMEVTESAVFEDPAEAREVLLQVRDRGIGVAIDDFGAGNTSLSYLEQLAATRLKIDRSFISQITTRVADQHIVAAVADLGHRLGMTVLAEGIEDEATLQVVRTLGCDLAQGYLFGRPAPLEELEPVDAAAVVARPVRSVATDPASADGALGVARM